MNRLRPPQRGKYPLHVLLMAGALIAAAIVGALVGFAIDFIRGSDEVTEITPDAP